MQASGIVNGDCVKIDSRKATTVAEAISAQAEKGTMLVNTLIRQNAKTDDKEWVKVSKSNAADAKKVVLVPLRDHLRVDENLIRHVKENLLGIPLVEHDRTPNVTLPKEYQPSYRKADGKGGTEISTTSAVEFVVKSCKPAGPTRIANESAVAIEREPAEPEAGRELVRTQVKKEAAPPTSPPPPSPKIAAEDGWRWETEQENRDRTMKKCPRCGTWNPKTSWKCSGCLHEFTG
jgi:hypothetical protein